ncbi:MAG: response regulator [Puniceicoccales bacterium]|jgi:DNA-binding response OmpR family regulator|nr:response regulator [Puniceicoccales bacterium]
MEIIKKVLFIDDDRIFLDTQTKFLKLSGFDVMKSPDGLKGFTSLERASPNIIVCDIMMENFSGLDFLNKFTQTHFFHKIPFLCISGYTTEGMAEQCMNYGADGYLRKPVDCDILICIIFALISYYSPGL